MWLLLTASASAQESAPGSRPAGSRPQREVSRWTAPLREALAGATLLRVHPVVRKPGRRDLLLEEKDPAAIARLVARIAIDDERSGGRCMCTGNQVLMFYRGDELLAEVGFHHGFRLRWGRGPWEGDATLEVESRDFVVGWLAERGLTAPREDLARQEAQARAEALTWERATYGLSETLAAALREGEAEFRRALEGEAADPKDRLRILLQVYGARAEPSESHVTGYMTRRLLDECEPHTLAAAARTVVLCENPVARLGAARILVARESVLLHGAPGDLAPLRSAIVAAEQGAGDPEERRQALEHLLRWSAELPVVDVSRRVRAASQDPVLSVRLDALHAIRKLGLRDEVPLLLARLRATLPADREGARRTAADPRKATAEERAAWQREHEVDTAALALGYLRAEEGRALLAARGDEVALALMGEPHRLRAAHFQAGPDGFAQAERRKAALEAVVRCRGRFGLELALDYRCENAGELDAAVRALRRMLLAQDPPGRGLLEQATSLADLRTWFAQHGEEYLKSLQ